MPTVEGFLNSNAFTITLESLGQIRVWRIEANQLIPSIRGTFETRDHIDGHPFMKVLLSKFATHVNPTNERTKGAKINPEEIEKLSSEDADQVAEEIIKHHGYLFEDQNKLVVKDGPPDAEGKATVEFSVEKIEIPRNEGETASEHLYRLVVGLAEREEIQRKIAIERMSEAISNIGSSFSSGWADSLRMPDLMIAPIRDPQHTTNEILREVLSELSDQKEINALTAQSIVTLGKRGEGWEELFKKNTTRSARQVKFANRVAVIAVVVGIAAIIVTIIFGYLSYKASAKPQSPPPVILSPEAESEPK